MNIRKGIIILAITLLPCALRAQADSAAVAAVVNDFYGWYIKSIQQQAIEEFQPYFVADEKGMTRLDMSVMEVNLRSHGFSEQMIMKTEEGYMTCAQQLTSIRFEDFTSKYQNPEKLQSIGCNFGETLLWIGGQDVPDGIQVSRIAITGSEATVLIKFYNASKGGGKEFWQMRLNAGLVKEGGHWKIVRLG